MEMFKNIRMNRGESILRKKMSRMNRVKFYSNLGKARSIGMVWDASNPDEFTVLSQFHQKMNERNIEVKILGFFPGKELPDRCTAIRYLTCFKNQDINFFYKPVSPEANSFINTRFDILIDVNFRKLFPLKYISSLSIAGFKVGIFEDDSVNSPYDLMMELNKDTDLNTYLTHVVHYLEMINTDTNKNSA
jgi:hypothetical protein